MLGRSLLGVNWELAASGRFSLYAFEVHVQRQLLDEERKRLRTLIEWAKPCQFQITESFTEIETVEGVKISPPDPTRTVVVAAEDFCAKAAQSNAAATAAAPS